MKSLIGIALITSIVTALIFNAAMTSDEGENTLDRNLAAELEAAQKRIDGLEEEVAKLNAKTVSKFDLLEQHREFATRRELDLIDQRLKALQSPQDFLNQTLTTEPVARGEVEALIDGRIKKMDEEKAKIRSEIKEKKTRTWISKVTADTVGRMTKRLSLSSDQQVRMTQVMEDTYTRNQPLYETLKNENTSAQDRLQAIQTVRGNLDNLRQNAQSIMSSSQFEQYEENDQETSNVVTRWIDGLEEELRNGK